MMERTPTNNGAGLSGPISPLTSGPARRCEAAAALGPRTGSETVSRRAPSRAELTDYSVDGLSTETN